jgi:hypothetical protein
MNFSSSPGVGRRAEGIACTARQQRLRSCRQRSAQLRKFIRSTQQQSGASLTAMLSAVRRTAALMMRRARH